MKDKHKKILKEYHCGYCKHKFQQWVGDYGTRERHRFNNHISSQVQCPNCQNFLKTWEEGTEI